MPRHASRPARRIRPLDRALGVSRSRRRVAYLSIAAGVRLLRPAVRRVGLLTMLVATPLVLHLVS